MKQSIILLGGGGHCCSCIDVIEQEGKYNIAGILDPNETIGNKMLGYEIIGSDDKLPELVKEVKFFLITVGQIKSASKRIELFNLVKAAGGQFPVIISPYAYVSKYALIGSGTIIMHHAVVNVNARIGENCIINSKALIEHDAIVGNHCHIATSAVVNGGVRVGNKSFIGSCATTVQGSVIPQNSFIKAGSLYFNKE
jgi:sugar O-acyltransferase (sialic acid O-acetyltransferase NeuD family)